MARNVSRQIFEDGFRTSAAPEAIPVADAQVDRLLVDRCLAGEVLAWEQLYNECHAPLCTTIKSLLGASFCDPNLIDEIAARVWFALVRNDGQLLDRFDPTLDFRLGAFFRGLARVEIMKYFRAENRRRARETKAGQKPYERSHIDNWQMDAMLCEFATTLTPGEQRFMDEFLLSLPNDRETSGDSRVSPANFWQRCHRIRTKLRTYFDNE
jgi:hypothetical protein